MVPAGYGCGDPQCSEYLKGGGLDPTQGLSSASYRTPGGLTCCRCRAMAAPIQRASPDESESAADALAAGPSPEMADINMPADGSCAMGDFAVGVEGECSVASCDAHLQATDRPLPPGASIDRSTYVTTSGDLCCYCYCKARPGGGCAGTVDSPAAAPSEEAGTLDGLVSNLVDRVGAAAAPAPAGAATVDSLESEEDLTAIIGGGCGPGDYRLRGMVQCNVTNCAAHVAMLGIQLSPDGEGGVAQYLRPGEGTACKEGSGCTVVLAERMSACSLRSALHHISAHTPPPHLQAPSSAANAP